MQKFSDNYRQILKWKVKLAQYLGQQNRICLPHVLQISP